jgi:predicted secreted protein
MPAFRWPELKHDVALANEVVQNAPEKPNEWEKIAETLSIIFTSWTKLGQSIEIKGRGCRERMDRLLEKHKQDEAKALKR